MMTVNQWMNIQLLHKQGHSIRKIAHLTGQSRNTIRKALRNSSVPALNKPLRKSKLDDYQAYLQQRYESCALSAVRLLEEIQPMGYNGSVETLRRYLQTLKPSRILRRELTVRFETPVGYQAQADWADCGRFTDLIGNWIGIHVFVIVLSFSRMMFVYFTTSMKIEELIRCHQLAFEYFGGWTQSILYDNMKQVRLSQTQWNPLFLDFTRYYGFIPKTHQPYRARTKGKVERMVDYLKDNFLNGRHFNGLEDLNAQAGHWLDHTANVRIHATTGQRPQDLFVQEKEKLTSLTSIPAYRYARRVKRQGSREGLVHFEGSSYSIPPQFVGQELVIEPQGQKIVIRSAEMIVAEHPLAAKPGCRMILKEHQDALWKLSLLRPMPPSPKWWMTFNQVVQTTPLEVYQQISL